MIICIEGIDGTGKTTQSKLLAERLKAKLWKFPNTTGDSPTGKAIYEHLKGKWAVTSEDDIRHGVNAQKEALTDALVFQALQLANRMEVANQLLEDSTRGHVVIDRYWPSGYAYGAADGLDPEHLLRLHRWLPQPDLFILLDADAHVLQERRPGTGDRYEADAIYLQRVASNYRGLWNLRRGASWQVVDARQDLESVTAAILGVVVTARAEFGLGPA